MSTAPARACDAHPDRPAAARCVSCQRPLCAACRSRSGEQSRCLSCHRTAITAAVRPPPAPARLMVTVLTVVGVVVIGVLAAGTVVVQVRAEARVRSNQAAMKALGFSLDDFFLDVSRYPTAEEGLAVLVTGDPDGDGVRVPGWRGPYLRDDLTPSGKLGSRSQLSYDRLTGEFLDAWGTPIVYWSAGDQTWVYAASAGVNGSFDTAQLGTSGFDGGRDGDDLVVWVEGP